MTLKIQSKNAITLISLVVTIIVLLILSGVALTMLTGENGILSMAKKAREKTEEAQADEQQKLLMLEAISSRSETEYKGVKIPAGYTPTKRAGEDEVNTGLVITDAKGNEWVWIAVSADLSACTTDAQIETALREYADTIFTEQEKNKKIGWEDRWYDKLGTIYNGEDYSEIKYIVADTNKTAETRFNEAQIYYGTLYTKTGESYNNIDQNATYEFGTTYYCKITDKLNDDKGCGLTYSEYNNNKSKMLQSIKNNGGFYIGRYEVGYIDSTKRTGGNANTAPTQTPVIKQNAYPYNFVTCSQAEKLVESLSSGSSDKTASLMFGLQWDLVLKFLKEKDSTINIANSTTWGNFRDVEFKVDRGEWAKYEGTAASTGIFYKFNDTAHYDKIYFKDKTKHGYNSSVSNENNGRVLLTTGAADRNCTCNIYDLAGNIWEWTLERASHSVFFCAKRGGGFVNDGTDYPASSCSGDTAVYHTSALGFRASLY